MKICFPKILFWWIYFILLIVWKTGFFFFQYKWFQTSHNSTCPLCRNLFWPNYTGYQQLPQTFISFQLFILLKIIMLFDDFVSCILKEKVILHKFWAVVSNHRLSLIKCTDISVRNVQYWWPFLILYFPSNV